jgi:hypothetical protein
MQEFYVYKNNCREARGAAMKRPYDERPGPRRIPLDLDTLLPHGISMTAAEIAALSGVVKETIRNRMKEWEAQGLVIVVRVRIKYASHVYFKRIGASTERAGIEQDLTCACITQMVRESVANRSDAGPA